MNLYYYLFYKLSQFLNKKGDNEWGPIYAITIIILMNIIFVYVKLFDITEENSQGSYKTILGIVIICIFITNAILFQDRGGSKKLQTTIRANLYETEKLGPQLFLCMCCFLWV